MYYDLLSSRSNTPLLYRANMGKAYRSYLDEARKTEAQNRKSSLWGSVGGMLMGVLPNLIFPGAGLLTSALMTGTGTYLGKKLGHAVAGGYAPVGKWDIAKDSDYRKMVAQTDIRDALSGAISAGLFKYYKADKPFENMFGLGEPADWLSGLFEKDLPSVVNPINLSPKNPYLGG